jgi:hypothetical protein
MAYEIVHEPQPIRKKPVDADQRLSMKCKVRFLKDGVEVGHTHSKNFFRNECISNQYLKY